jgi:hypothetical protein
MIASPSSRIPPQHLFAICYPSSSIHDSPPSIMSSSHSVTRHEFENARDAMQYADVAGGVAILVGGRALVVKEAEATRLGGPPTSNSHTSANSSWRTALRAS